MFLFPLDYQSDNYLQFIPLNVVYGSATVILPESDDGTSDAITLPDGIGFPFGRSIQTEIYVSISIVVLLDYYCAFVILRLAPMDSFHLVMHTTPGSTSSSHSPLATSWLHSGMMWTLEEAMGKFLMRFTTLAISLTMSVLLSDSRGPLHFKELGWLLLTGMQYIRTLVQSTLRYIHYYEYEYYPHLSIDYSILL